MGKRESRRRSKKENKKVRKKKESERGGTFKHAIAFAEQSEAKKNFEGFTSRRG